METGCIPIRFILKSRRVNFLHYILSDKEESLLSNIFRAQCDNPVKGDWVTTVQNDLKELELDISFEQIKAFTKDEFRIKEKKLVRRKAFEYLQNLQQTHSSDKNKVTKVAKTLRNKFLNYQVHRKNGNNLPSAAPIVINNLNNVSNDCGDMD